MELIERIVPAIRETRIPLITGYAWVLAIWLIANRIIHLVGPEDAPLEKWTPL